MDSGQQKTALAELSDNLAAAVERAGRSIVRVDARGRVAASGLVWRADGLIVTADHVIERQDGIVVGLPDGVDVPAQLVGRDPGTDLAVLKVDAQGLTPIEPATDDAKVGHIVLALGRPVAGPPMASLGVVSAVGGSWRTWRGGTIEGVVRSDVTLYPGFSGGPLVNAHGTVIGINSSILGRGLAVTLPHRSIGPVADSLVAQGKVQRGFLGIAAQPVALPAALRQQLGLGQETGLLIVGLEAGGPAEMARLLIGDIVVGLAGQPVGDLETLQAALGPGAVGQTVPARVIRGGQLVDVSVTVGER